MLRRRSAPATSRSVDDLPQPAPAWRTRSTPSPYVATASACSGVGSMGAPPSWGGAGPAPGEDGAGPAGVVDLGGGSGLGVQLVEKVPERLGALVLEAAQDLDQLGAVTGRELVHRADLPAEQEAHGVQAAVPFLGAADGLEQGEDPPHLRGGYGAAALLLGG